MKILHLLIAFCIFFSIGCNALGAAVEETEYPLEIVDAYGTVVIIEKEPQRIVSTMPSNTEILFAIGAGEDVVGGTVYDTYPPEAKEVEKVGGHVTLDLEKIIDLEPDLVVAGEGNGEENVDMMREEFGMTVVVLKPENVDDIIENIKLLGQITNNNEDAHNITSEMQQQIDDIAENVEVIPEEVHPRVMYIVWEDPLYAAGNNTFPNDLIEIAGGNNIMESDGWPISDLEYVLEKDPEIIICSSMGAEDQSVSEELAEKIRNNELLAYTNAVKNNRVIPISDPKLIEIPGPRIVLGLDELYNIIDPIAEEKIQEMELEPNDGNNESSGLTEEADNNEDTPQSSGFGILLSSASIAALYLVIGRIRK